MDVSGLFYPSTARAEAAEGKAKRPKTTMSKMLIKTINGVNELDMVGSIGRLPRRSVRYEPFTPPVPTPFSLLTVFALFGGSKDKILCADSAGHAAVFDAASRFFLAMPEMNSPKGCTHAAVSIRRTAAHARSDFEVHPEVDTFTFTGETGGGDWADSLYVLDMVPGGACRFEVLAYYPLSNWCWRPLPPPPFAGDREYKAPLVANVAVVDGATICVSTAAATYAFDTVALRWSKAGDWVLPFAAEYVPELGAWFGLSNHRPDYDLCAMDGLSAAAGSSPPTVQHLGRELEVEPPVSWSFMKHRLVNLGAGRFCIAREFDVADERDECNSIPVTVFTGVEVVPGGERGLRMVRHKSKSIIASITSVL
ncbi:hypothetical protein ACP70R_033298 [Stipagrostis hirtigluma subsp. patula]